MFGRRRDTCTNKLAAILDKELFKKCLEFMFRIKQARHLKALSRQLCEFDRLQYKHYGCVCSYTSNHVHNIGLHNRNVHNSSSNAGSDNNDNNSDNRNSSHRGDSDRNNDDAKMKWVVSMSNTPLTEVQRSLLARGAQFCGGP